MYIIIIKVKPDFINKKPALTVKKRVRAGLLLHLIPAVVYSVNHIIIHYYMYQGIA